MTEVTLTDEFGRQVNFVGEQLVEDNTDTEDGRKPQWLEIEIWRTERGNYVVRRDTCYRVFHASRTCSKADGYALVEASEDDTYNCPQCAANSSLEEPGWAQDTRSAVDVYSSPRELIESFRQDGRHNHFARSVLAEVSKKDAALDAAWNRVVVP